MNLDLLMSGRWLSMTDDLNLGIEFRYVRSLKTTTFSLAHFCLQSIIVLVFFPTYVIFQPPATVASRKFGPRIFLSTICLLWGATEIVSLLLSLQAEITLTPWHRLSASSRSGRICLEFASFLVFWKPASTQVSCTCWQHGTLAVSDFEL